MADVTAASPVDDPSIVIDATCSASAMAIASLPPVIVVVVVVVITEFIDIVDVGEVVFDEEDDVVGVVITADFCCSLMTMTPLVFLTLVLWLPPGRRTIFGLNNSEDYFHIAKIRNNSKRI